MTVDNSGTRTNGVNSGSRTSNWNNYPWNSNWNIGLRAACDDRQNRTGQSRLPVPTDDRTVVSHAILLRQIHCEVKGTSSSETSKDGLTFLMGKKHKNLTSQLFANVYGHILDRHLTHTLKVGPWLRYMDDTVIFAHSRESLAVLQQGLEWFCGVHMGLRFSKWGIGPITQGLDWLGYRIWPTYKLLRRNSVLSAKRKIARYRETGDCLALSRFAASWRGHAKWANSFNLVNQLGIAP